MYIFPAPLADTALALRNGQLDLAVYIDELCERIDVVDQQVQALLPEPDRWARLQREALALQARYPDPTRRPPLYGIPVGIKDIFHVDGFPTRAGTEVPAHLFAGPEATCVTALRAAGALILGKTVTTEFAYIEPGPTRNPHNPRYTPGGSSSGSAAAVAAGMCPLALGTQTVGSVIRPAAFCGVVGFKPSYGRIPVDGIVPFAPSADHVGLFTQDSAGMCLAASVLCHDWRDPDPQIVSRLPVLGVPAGAYLEQATPEVLTAFAAHLRLLEQTGYTVRQIPVLADIAAIAQRHRQLIAAEMAQIHATWFAQYAPLYRPSTAALIREGQAVSATTLAAARAGQIQLRSDLMAVMTEAGIDLWLCPATTQTAPPGIGSTGDPAMSTPWTHAGLPTLTLPIDPAANGLPLGIQYIAPFMADERLLAWSLELEGIL